MTTSVPKPLAVSTPGGSNRVFALRWAGCSSAGAAVVTGLDAVLLQRRESYFTGGFLSTDHLQGPLEGLLFLGLSFLSDFAVIGLIVAAIMWAGRRLRPRAAVVAACAAGMTPLVAADILEYELVRYLGDAVDLRLMFELTGGNLSELAAAASAHLVMPFGVALVCIAFLVALVRAVHRRESASPVGRPSARAMGVPACVAAAGLLITTTAIVANDRLENGLLRKPSGKVLGFVADEVTDIDRDGFGIASRMADPDPRDPQVFPYALDRPGNGVDEDGVGGDLPADGADYVEHPVLGSWTRHPDVVLVVLESFRFDVIGAGYGGRPVTPVLDALASRGASSGQTYSHNGYTAQSRFHMLAGSLADVRDRRSLIDDFKANGYTVAYVSGQDESFGGARYDTGFARADIAIDARSTPERRYTTFTTAGSLAVPFTVVEEQVDRVLAERVLQDRPLFLYVNFHDTHFPYTHEGVAPLVSDVRLSRSQIVPEERENLWATYVNTAANVDGAIGRVLESVRRARGVDPAVIVTSDHGESLFDDGFLGHGHALNQVQTQVPLIVTNLPIVIREPFAHVSLRDAIGDALRTPPDVPAVPQLRASEEVVFQYLGNVNRPRQIALTNVGGRVIYDFRSQRVQFGEGRPQRPGELSAHEAAEFLRLVHYWERMMLARERAADRGFRR